MGLFSSKSSIDRVFDKTKGLEDTQKQRYVELNKLIALYPTRNEARVHLEKLRNDVHALWQRYEEYHRTARYIKDVAQGVLHPREEKELEEAMSLLIQDPDSNVIQIGIRLNNVLGAVRGYKRIA